MNLFYMAGKTDGRLKISGTVRPTSRKLGGVSWRGLEIEPGPEPQLVLKQATRMYPLRERCETVGWKAGALEKSGSIRVSFLGAEGLPAWKANVGTAFTDVLVPWPLDVGPKQPWDLAIHVTPQGGPVFLGIHKPLDRAETLALCTGAGVELGPGPKPQVLPGPGVTVRYVEQKSPEEWARLYGDHYGIAADKALWGHYVVGEAHDLPVEDESLDFIFSSHVFEHLANPLGHLELWRRKLKSGGRIVAVVPDLAGSKDQAAPLTSLAEAIGEHGGGRFTATIDHYHRFIDSRHTKDTAQDLFDQKKSIHVHFYTNTNMSALLDYAVRELGFSSYSIRHTPNNKEFHFVVTR